MLDGTTASAPAHALCPQCNYPLRGLDGRNCPECGTAFDPADVATMNLGLPLNRLDRMLLRPVGWRGLVVRRLLVCVGVLGPAWLVPSRVAGVLWLLLWGVFVVGLWVRSLLRAWVVRRRRQPRDRLEVDEHFLRRTRVAFAVVTLLILTRLPFLLALSVSRLWLDPMAYHLWADSPPPDPPDDIGRVGLVWVRGIDVTPSTIEFGLAGGASLRYTSAPDGQHLQAEWETWDDTWNLW